MKCVDRQGKEIEAGTSQTKVVGCLYKSVPGRMLLSILTRPLLSKAAGKFLDSGISAWLIPGFVRANGICLDDYEQCVYGSFNEFFTRRIKSNLRPICKDASALISPCDGYLTVYDIREDSHFKIKGRAYTMMELVRSEQLAKHYCGGKLLLVRLTVKDYHRYCYPDAGQKSRNYRLPGVFHTVHPIAAGEYPIYKENTREFSLLRTEQFGTVLMMQVGAMLVGRIVNHHQAAHVERGEEAGMFQYGGSTVILCLEPGVASIDENICLNSALDAETRVVMGEQIGQKKK